MVRTPQPELRLCDISCSAIRPARGSSTMPLHSRWPMFEHSESIWRFSWSSPST